LNKTEKASFKIRRYPATNYYPVKLMRRSLSLFNFFATAGATIVSVWRRPGPRSVFSPSRKMLVEIVPFGAVEIISAQQNARLECNAPTGFAKLLRQEKADTFLGARQ
jgi:hypothetical protein